MGSSIKPAKAFNLQAKQNSSGQWNYTLSSIKLVHRGVWGNLGVHMDHGNLVKLHLLSLVWQNPIAFVWIELAPVGKIWSAKKFQTQRWHYYKHLFSSVKFLCLVKGIVSGQEKISRTVLWTCYSIGMQGSKMMSLVVDLNQFDAFQLLC